MKKEALTQKWFVALCNEHISKPFQAIVFIGKKKIYGLASTTPENFAEQIVGCIKTIGESDYERASSQGVSVSFRIYSPDSDVTAAGGTFTWEDYASVNDFISKDDDEAVMPEQ